MNRKKWVILFNKKIFKSILRILIIIDDILAEKMVLLVLQLII